MSTTEHRHRGGHVAVVTGAAMGIGYAIAHRLAEDGNDVAIFDINTAAGDEAAAKIASETGARAIACTVDVADRAQVATAVEKVRAELGPILILVNNAGIEQFGPFTEIDPANWNRVMEVNLTGTFHCTQLIVTDMIAAEWGRIVNVSSSSAQRGSKNMTAYSASKGAMISLTRSLALELGVHGITVNNVPPGFIETPMLHKSLQDGKLGSAGLETQIAQTPVRRVGQPEDLAAACAFLASNEAGYITGQTFGVNGGRVPS
jgi:2-hydroxycyclohexanecarboxyl-CoA dehydrogenase